ncbi:MAG TPA: glycoside hydrolase family 19 protein [Thermoanaerobaculia bacterium]|nr:glycoside hydrolase family 19 protein [Thermoanaerobaculia bacterium]
MPDDPAPDAQNPAPDAETPPADDAASAIQGLTVDTLVQVMPLLPQDRAAVFLPHLVATLQEFDISTSLRVAAFLAQIAHESAQLKHLEEILNYSANGLLNTWPKRFTPETANAYARQPERIANLVYGGRGGNGDEASGDGWRYRGRGLIQLTFRDNYRRAGEALGLPIEDQPDTVATPEIGSRSAGLYWKDNGLNTPADAGEFEKITRRINGGLAGQPERLAFYEKAKQVLGI